MNIQIEVLVVLAIIGVIIIFSFLMFLIKWYKIWRYKPENDKGRRAEESRRSLQGTVLPRGRLLQTEPSNNIRKDYNSPRETSSSHGKVGNPFTRHQIISRY